MQARVGLVAKRTHCVATAFDSAPRLYCGISSCRLRTGYQSAHHPWTGLLPKHPSPGRLWAKKEKRGKKGTVAVLLLLFCCCCCCCWIWEELFQLSLLHQQLLLLIHTLPNLEMFNTKGGSVPCTGRSKLTGVVLVPLDSSKQYEGRPGMGMSSSRYSLNQVSRSISILG